MPMIYLVTQCLKHYQMMKINLINLVEKKDTLNNPDDSNNGYIVKVDLSCTDNIKEETKDIPFFPENKI